jgi:prophage antirepressor-like protein
MKLRRIRVAGGSSPEKVTFRTVATLFPSYGKQLGKAVMNPIQKFTHALTSGYVVEISAIIDANGAHWFLASETARALGYVRPNDAVSVHCKFAQPIGNHGETPYLGFHPQTKIIPEGDVNRLISRSQLPAAVEIQDWWFDEVIPSIRRTGGYGVQRSSAPQKEISRRELALMVIEAEDRAEAETVARIAAQRQVQDLSNQNVSLAQNLHNAQDLANRFRQGISTLTALMGTPDGICLRDAANQLEQPQHEFNRWLHSKGWIYRSRSKSNRWKPHAAAIANGWLGDKEYIRPKDSDEVTLYTPDMGPVDPNLYYLFREVEITHAGMVKILQYADHPNPDAPALRIKRQEYRVAR